MKLADLDINKVYSYADYFKWKFEERVELIRGYIFKMSPAPNVRHQQLSAEIGGQLWSFLRGKKCQVFTAPFDVRLPRKSTDDKEIITVVQPDICVICDPSKLDKRGCLGAPDIVVEILSPGNNTKELKNKYEVYEEAGIKEYWVVSPQDNTFFCIHTYQWPLPTLTHHGGRRCGYVYSTGGFLFRPYRIVRGYGVTE